MQLAMERGFGPASTLRHALRCGEISTKFGTSFGPESGRGLLPGTEFWVRMLNGGAEVIDRHPVSPLRRGRALQTRQKARLPSPRHVVVFKRPLPD
jgi:hypothetical protein